MTWQQPERRRCYRQLRTVSLAFAESGGWLMYRRTRRYRRTWYWRWRGGLYPRGVIALPWGRYERYAYLYWRIRIPLWLAGAGAGCVLAGPGGLVGGLAMAYIAEGLLSYRRATIPGRGPTVVSRTDADVAAARAQARRWETEAVPSPGGWRPPDNVLPAWSWVPPAGITARLDRVPAWVRFWYATPLLDRYAHAWMWEHGGYDVLPPGPELGVSET
jgi:hypothetical protein